MVIEIFDVVVGRQVIRCPMDKDYWRIVEERRKPLHVLIPPFPISTCDSDDTVRIRSETCIATITFGGPFIKPFSLWGVADM